MTEKVENYIYNLWCPTTNTDYTGQHVFTKKSADAGIKEEWLLETVSLVWRSPSQNYQLSASNWIPTEL